MTRHQRVALLCVLAASCIAADPECARIFEAEGDLMLHRDIADPETGELLELPPFAPWVQPGADGRLGTGDDEVRSFAFLPADIDLIVRTGLRSFSGPVPVRSRPPDVVAEPFGEGTPLEFVVAAVNGYPGPGWLEPTDPPSLEGSPVLVMAFADLDGDGAIGITLSDGDPFDASLEGAELEPVGRRLAIASGGRASGEFFVSAGGPPGAELDLIVGAAAFTGPFDPGHFGGEVPSGPMVMTRLPFLPETDPNEVIDGNLPGPADPFGLAGVEVKQALEPDPTVPDIGESFTVPVHGIAPSIDGARAHSGAFARFGLVAEPAASSYRDLASRPLRPGLDSSGDRVLFEVLQHAFVDDDGSASARVLRVVALDRFGNVTTPSPGSTVTVVADGPVRITSPDGDGNPAREVVVLSNARGIALTIDDGGGAFDDSNLGGLSLEYAGGLSQLPIWLPDPDVDDSGEVDGADVALAQSLDRLEVGDPGYDFQVDLTGDGRIDEDDVVRILANDGLIVSIP
ncbi:MAG: hypothetical protein OEP95_03255 [Myxococcales bacterium]|nr:hypothetical protein [Myxococcales bacterium]